MRSTSEFFNKKLPTFDPKTAGKSSVKFGDDKVDYRKKDQVFVHSNKLWKLMNIGFVYINDYLWSSAIQNIWVKIENIKSVIKIDNTESMIKSLFESITMNRLIDFSRPFQMFSWIEYIYLSRLMIHWAYCF